MVIQPSNAPPAQTRARGRNKRPRTGRNSKATTSFKASTSAARKWIQVKRSYGKIVLNSSWVAVDELTEQERETYLPAPPQPDNPEPVIPEPTEIDTLTAASPPFGETSAMAIDEVPAQEEPIPGVNELAALDSVILPDLPDIAGGGIDFSLEPGKDLGQPP